MLAVGTLLCSWYIGMQGIVPQAYAAGTVEVEVSASDTEIEQGQPFAITVRVRNRSSETRTENVVLHLHKTMSAQHISGDGRKSGSRIVWNDVQLRGNSRKTFTVSASITKGDHGDRVTAMAVAGNAHDSVHITINDPADNVNAAKMLSISLNTSKTYAAPGSIVQFEVHLRNRGTETAKNIGVVLQAPDHLEFLSASNDADIGTTEVEWKNIHLQPNASLDMHVSARIGQNNQHGDRVTVTAIAEGKAAQADVRVWQPDFAVEQLQLFAFTEEDVHAPGEELEYTMRVRNLATRDERATLQAYIDEKTRFVSASENGMQFHRTLIVWENVDFKQGETKSFSLTVRIDDDAPPASAVRLGIMAGIDRKEIVTRIAAPPPPPIPPAAEPSAPQESADPPQPAAQEHLLLTLQASAEEAQPGSHISYAIRLLNTSDTPMQNTRVYVNVPENASITNAAGGNAEQGTLTWNIANLQPQETWNTTIQLHMAENLVHGNSQTVHVRAEVATDTVAQEWHTVRIVELLPQTGTAPSQITAQIVPVQPSAPSLIPPVPNRSIQLPRLPAWVFAAIAAIGLAAGAGAGWFLLQREPA